ncbi:hypothetical protein CGK30_17635 [Vibrio parahaemolyticus]|nr:hypothetical protein CGK30_17635 [Vibrio parahaemolyticus]
MKIFSHQEKLAAHIATGAFAAFGKNMPLTHLSSAKRLLMFLALKAWHIRHQNLSLSLFAAGRQIIKCS